ncbi:quinohemoprotein amine dehydrogenase subunit alpha [Aliarcobacter butzleri]|uniref:quinohemoprotein amine dehydrogenase subunit alpha n=1 Tax=Aliarcobacter butzleri TaxID=28197 RepID=UPI003AC1324B
MNYKRLSKFGMKSLVLLAALPLFAVDAQKGKEVIESKCIACHTGDLKNGLSRISDQRKTPEGWYMTVKRMQREHGLSITRDEETNVIKYLADYQGLTPDEIKPYSYVLDKTPNIQEESKDELLTEMCVRCHSEARIGLQRRTANEWNSLVNYHVAQFPSFEVQAQARDRDWFGVAQNEVVPYLAENFGKDKEKFDKYIKSVKNYELPKKWITYGHTPILGDFTATLTLIKSTDESYAMLMDYKYASGEEYKGRGIAVVYGGSEIRASFEVNGVKYRQTLHLNPKTNSFEGRMFEALHPENGSTLVGKAKDSKETALVAVYPKAVKAGEKSTISIVGTNLVGDIKLPSSLKVLKTIKHTNNEIILEVVASKISKTIDGNISIGTKTFKNSLVVYDKVDYLKVTPDYAISRIGGEEGKDKILKEYATFEAIGYSFGKDGKKGTADDIELGVLPATWSLEAYDEQAQEDKDLEYVGQIDVNTGKFTPSIAGPNEERKLMTNNAGNISVVATYKDGQKELSEKSHMIVTVPKFVNPPIN